MSEWRVYLRDENLTTIGQLDVWDKLEIVMRANRAGSFVIGLPGNHPQASLLSAGVGIIVYSPHVPDEPIFTGKVKTIERASVDGYSTTTCTVTGIDDTARLARRLAWPKPTAAITAQTDPADVRTGAAETVIRGYIGDNAGPSAYTGRPIAGLTLTADGTRGTSIDATARYDNLLELCASLAAVGGVVFWVQQDGNGLELRFREPADRSLDVRFSSLMGNLRDWKYNISEPAATRAIVGGLGVDEDREMNEATATAAEAEWGDRIETFVDASDIDDPDVLVQRGEEELATAGATAGLSISPVDIPAMRYGVDYFLGDTVSVEVEGERIVQPVSEVKITVGRDGAVTTPTIGDPDIASESPALYARVRSIAKRVGLVERRK